MNNIVLRLSGITKVYNRGEANALPVLQGADFMLEKGQLVALVAPSGTGKSTLLHLAGLLDTPDKGEIEICGQKASGITEPQRTGLRRDRIGFVYQFHHLLGEFTALENVMLPQMIAGVHKNEARFQAKELLNLFGLSHRVSHLPGKLSGGEQQRVAIARALANKPSLLLADEPTGNLDVNTADRVFEELTQAVREQGLAALIATHNEELLSRMDKVITLRDGLIAER